MKLGRTYKMTVQVSESDAVEIAYPLTLSFDVTRNTLASANKGMFRLFNLKPDTRKQIYHDRYDTMTYRQIKVQAGYETQSPLPVIFQGNIIQAYSYRQGTNWITEIEAFDGGFGIINSEVSQTIPSGWSLDQIIRTVLGSMQRVDVGAIGDYSEENSRGITLMGNSWNITNRIASGQNGVAFIDNEKANVLLKNEYVEGDDNLALITSDTGLLQTPRRYDARLDANILFEPRLVVGQRVVLQTLETLYNGVYQVIGVQHQGTISGAVGGECKTVAGLWLGTSRLAAVAA